MNRTSLESVAENGKVPEHINEVINHTFARVCKMEQTVNEARAILFLLDDYVHHYGHEDSQLCLGREMHGSISAGISTFTNRVADTLDAQFVDACGAVRYLDGALSAFAEGKGGQLPGN